MSAIKDRVGLRCIDCERLVRNDHPECGGDPRVTCVIYGCGLATVAKGDLRAAGCMWVRVGYCAEHQGLAGQRGDARMQKSPPKWAPMQQQVLEI